MKDDTISRAAAIDAIDGIPWYHQNQHGEMVHGANSDEHQAWYKAEDIYKTIECVPPTQPGWIPCTPETMPEREGRYVCTYTYDGKKDVFMFRYEDGQFMVPWYVDAITAWYKPLDPWEGGQE